MAGIEMVRHDRQICIRDFVAAIRERDPQQCWIFQPSINYNDFKHLQESTCKAITGSKVESTRTRKRKGVESNNPAGNDENVYNYLAFDYEEDSDDVTLGEFLRKQRTLKVNKNKRKQKALQVKEARLSVAKPSHAGSCGRLGGLKPSGSVSGVHEPVAGIGGAKKKQKTSEVEKATGSYGGLGGLKPPGSVSRVHEPVVGVSGAKKKQKAIEVENARLFVAKPGGLVGLRPPGSVVGAGGAKKKQISLEIEDARLSVAKPSPAHSCGGLGGLKLPGSVSGLYGAKKKQKGLGMAKPSLAGPSDGPGWLRLPGSVSRVHEPVVGADKGKGLASEMALVNPWYREVLVCSTNRNPAEFSTETAKSFMRRIMS